MGQMKDYLDLADDGNTGEYAALAIAAEMAGMEYADYVEALGNEIDAERQQAEVLTTDQFSAVRAQVTEMTGGNREQMVEQMRGYFGVNYAVANDLLSMSDREAVAAIREAQDG